MLVNFGPVADGSSGWDDALPGWKIASPWYSEIGSERDWASANLLMRLDAT